MLQAVEVEMVEGDAPLVDDEDVECRTGHLFDDAQSFRDSFDEHRLAGS